MNEGYFQDDTIAAIATASEAVSPVGIIRISGANARDILLRLIRKPFSDSFFSPAELESHKLRRCHCFTLSGSLLDDAMFVWMQAPNSFTGEDVVELHLHGNPFTMRRVLAEILSCGARMALPGEFSFRAFRSGKIDLSQAEAIMDVVASRTSQGVENALQSLLGSTKKLVDELKSELVHLLAALEVDIDFSDQGLSSLDYVVWSERLVAWKRKVLAVRDGFRRTAPLREGVRVAIVGAPNSGKSTLFNALLKDDRSIVSSFAGTTRDIVRESLQLGDRLFLLSDTAGIRETSDFVEAQGITRSRAELRCAQVILWVVDASISHIAEVEKNQLLELRAENAEAALVIVYTKLDLLSDSPDTALADSLGIPFLFVSSISTQGFPQLEKFLVEVTTDKYQDDGFGVGRLRHFELLGKALISVDLVLARTASDIVMSDLLASDLRNAISSLGEITGDVSSDDILNHIFSEFCIGK